MACGLAAIRPAAAYLPPPLIPAQAVFTTSPTPYSSYAVSVQRQASRLRPVRGVKEHRHSQGRKRIDDRWE